MNKNNKNFILNKLLKEGMNCLNNNNCELAIENFEKILAEHPENSQILNLIGIAYHQLNKSTKALDYINKAIKNNSNEIGFHINLGNIYRDLKDFLSSKKAYNNALKINNRSVEALYNIGVLYTTQYKYTEAIIYYEKSIKIDPTHKHAFDNLGNAYADLAQFDKAITCYNKAINIDENFYNSQYNLGLILLLTKSFKLGWEKYEFRLKKDNYKKNIPFLNYKYWGGLNLQNKSLLIYCEQGIGDSIQFVRYIKKIKKNKTIIILYCNKNIAPLFKNILEIDFIITTEQTFPKIDYYVSVMSLPYIFRNDKSLPESCNFFLQDRKKTIYWQSKFITKKKIKVGIAWQGSISHVSDYKRSIKLKKFEPLFKLQDIDFISLQKDNGREQIISNKFEKFVIDYFEDIDSFQDTLAIIENLDLVISVDTAVAHIAATMDKETWILLPFVPDFRWGLNDTKTAWYKSVKLFRQSNNNQWDQVIIEVKKALQKKYRIN